MGKSECELKPAGVINISVLRDDANGKVTGKAKYTDDLLIDNVLHAAMVRSPYAHARVLVVDKEEADKADGVRLVITSLDDSFPRESGKEMRIFPWDKVRFRGESVAMVVAETYEQAQTAARLVRVKYEALPEVLVPEEAVKPDSPKVHGDSNIGCSFKIVRGDVDEAFKSADVVIAREFKTQAVEHAYMETEIVIAVPEVNDAVTIIGSFKYPHGVRDRTAGALNMSQDKVVVKCPVTGGVFGGKDDDAAVMAVRAALAARILHRPVKIKNTREESMLESIKRHPYSIQYALAAKKNGEILGVKVKLLADAGAFLGRTPLVAFRTTVECLGPYRVPNVNIDTTAVFTNTHNKGAMRGFGSPQAVFAVESMIDELAVELQKDPLELRMKNALQNGDVTANGQELSGVTVLESMEKAAFALDYQRKCRECAAIDPSAEKKKGIGIASSIRGLSLGGGRFDTTTATILVQKDGSVTLSTGICEFGQGARTAMRQIAAEALGVPVDMVTFHDWHTGDTPDSGPTVASRGTLMHGNAVINAANAVNELTDKIVCQMLDTTPAHIRRSHGYIWAEGAPDNKILFKEIAKECWNRSIVPYTIGHYSAPDTYMDTQTGEGRPYMDYVYGTDMAEVEVDVKTGKVEVLNFVSVHDLGFTINPTAAKGQVYGGVAMGLGQALFEEIDSLVTKPINFEKYVLPTALDMPRITVEFIESKNPAGPFGATSLAEPSNSNVTAAIVNAISHALGRRIYELPADLEEVLLGGPESKKESE